MDGRTEALLVPASLQRFCESETLSLAEGSREQMRPSVGRASEGRVKRPRGADVTSSGDAAGAFDMLSWDGPSAHTAQSGQREDTGHQAGDTG